MIFGLYIFHRQYCVFLHTWSHNYSGDKSGKTSSRAPKGRTVSRSDQKLLSGLLFSLKSFSLKMSPSSSTGGALRQPFNSFTTSVYKLHCYETLSGYKFVLMTDPTVPEMSSHLQNIHQTIFVDHVVWSPSYVPGGVIMSNSVVDAVDQYVKRSPYFNSPPVA
eukprot:Lankesteria_metandrocarpae@DN1046_c0_g1_i1.p1